MRSTAALNKADTRTDKVGAAHLLQTANAYRDAGEPVLAEQRYREALESDAHSVEAHYRLALFLLNQARADEALPLIDAAVVAQPGNPALHLARAMIFASLGKHLEALESMAAGCRIHRANAGTLYNIGLLYAELCCPAQAEVVARRLLALRPDWPAAHYLLVRARTALDSDPAELSARYAYLVKTDSLNPALRFARGLQQLRTGDYRAGWEAQEWRWEIEPVKSSRFLCAQPRWAGGSLEDRRLLVTGEQGFGDVLQVVRYLPLLISQGAEVTLRLDANRASLARLLRTINGLKVITEATPLPPFDLHCPLASLPYVFDTTPDTIPATPYRHVDEADVAAWRARLVDMPRPWTGVCWAGSAEHDHNIRRSLPLCTGSRYYADRRLREQRIGAASAVIADACGLQELTTAAVRDAAPGAYTMEPLLRKLDGSIISLQIGPHAQDFEELPAGLRARSVAPLADTCDFYDTACLVRALDQVITVDTSVAHVAGAIGQRGLIIKPAAPEWRWIEQEGKPGRSAWYPSLALMEQRAIAGFHPSSEDWGGR